MPETSSKRRVFIALMPTPEERDAIASSCGRFLDGERLRPQSASGWHVTLRFVGDVEAVTVDQLTQIVYDVSRHHASIRLDLASIEPFPNARRPLVLAATGPSTRAAVSLVEELETNCRTLGLRPDTRTWRSHMTLARIRGRRPFDFQPQTFAATLAGREIHLMESVPTDDGREYVSRVAATFALN